MLVHDLLVSYVEPTMIRLELDPKSQKWILLWDVQVYATHDSVVLDTLKKTFPNLILLYVPVSTTSELQPLDKSIILGSL